MTQLKIVQIVFLSVLLINKEVRLFLFIRAVVSSHLLDDRLSAWSVRPSGHPFGPLLVKDPLINDFWSGLPILLFSANPL